ncbi:hypothetical protein BC567DRAFT_55148 [Phyllosticta citribraziliensis]
MIGLWRSLLSCVGWAAALCFLLFSSSSISFLSFYFSAARSTGWLRAAVDATTGCVASFGLGLLACGISLPSYTAWVVVGLLDQ